MENIKEGGNNRVLQFRPRIAEAVGSNADKVQNTLEGSYMGRETSSIPKDRNEIISFKEGKKGLLEHKLRKYDISSYLRYEILNHDLIGAIISKGNRSVREYCAFLEGLSDNIRWQNRLTDDIFAYLRKVNKQRSFTEEGIWVVPKDYNNEDLIAWAEDTKKGMDKISGYNILIGELKKYEKAIEDFIKAYAPQASQSVSY